MSLDEFNAMATGFITRTGHRGRGIGKIVWEACKKQIKRKNLFINAIIPAISTYTKQGAILPARPFEICEIFFTLMKQFDEKFMNEIVKTSYCLKTYEANMFNALDKYDATFHSIKRSHFVRVHLEKSHSVKVAYDEEGTVCGYGAVREGL